MDENQLAQAVAKIILESNKPDHVGDAIKIGLPLLGAVIASVVGYFSARKTAEISKETQLSIAKINSNTQMKAIENTNATQIEITTKNKELESWKSYEARRSTRYEQLIDEIHQFNRTLFSHVTNVKNWLENRELGKDVKDGELEEIRMKENHLKDKFLDLLGVEAKLLVNGDLNEQVLIRKYGESAQTIFNKVHIDNKSITISEIDELMEDMRDIRRKIFISIGDTERGEKQVNLANR